MSNIITHLDLDMMNYPIGKHLRQNRRQINAMIDAIEGVETFKGKYINLVCRGSSGAIIAAIISVMIKNDNHIVHVKKEGEGSHCENDVKLNNDGIIIIVDDFIASGKTINAIYNHLTKLTKNPELVVDCLCVSGYVVTSKFNFTINNIICGSCDKDEN